MTKFEKKLCSYLGCHIKRSVAIVVFDPKTDESNVIYFCYKHYPSYIGYMAEHFKSSRSPLDMKLQVMDGKSLFHDK